MVDLLSVCHPGVGNVSEAVRTFVGVIISGTFIVDDFGAIHFRVISMAVWRIYAIPHCAGKEGKTDVDGNSQSIWKSKQIAGKSAASLRKT